MADVADPVQSPSTQDDALAAGAANGAPGDNRGVKRPRPSAVADDDDDDDDKPGRDRERRKIDIKFIVDKSRRHITFSKRKAGIMKKVKSISTAQRDSRPVKTPFTLLLSLSPPLPLAARLYFSFRTATGSAGG